MLLQDKWYSLIGKKLRDESKSVTEEPLPRRWIELIQHLDEQERQRERASAPVLPPERKH
jgi:hypothetical protein